MKLHTYLILALPISLYYNFYKFFRCSIDLSHLEREKTHRIKQDLEDGAGTIFLLLTISGTTASETISDLTTYEENPREKQIIEERYVSFAQFIKIYIFIK